MIAEDDELIGELLGEMLFNLGHVVCAVESSEAGTVEAAWRCQPELLIVDLQLSPGSGIDAIALITQTMAVPHILASGNIARLREQRTAAITLQKPYTQALLVQAIRHASERG